MAVVGGAAVLMYAAVYEFMRRRHEGEREVFRAVAGHPSAEGVLGRGAGGPEVGRFCVDYGYLPSYLYRWLRGEVPRAEKLLVLAKQLGVEPDWLLGVEEPPRRRMLNFKKISR